MLNHQQHWVPGSPIPDQILASVAAARRTLVLLSPAFLASAWSRLEFNAAHGQALQDNAQVFTENNLTYFSSHIISYISYIFFTQRVVVVLLGKRPSRELVPTDLNRYLAAGVFIDSADSKFWHKLRCAGQFILSLINLNTFRSKLPIPKKEKETDQSIVFLS